MREIVLFFFPLLGLSFSNASEHTLTYEYGVLTTSERVNLTSGDYRNKITKKSSNISYQGEEILPNTSLNSSVKIEQPDYSNIIVTDKEGNQQLLSTKRGEKHYESRGTLGLTFGKGDHSISINGDTNLNESPYAYQALKLSYAHDFKVNGTRTEVGVNYKKSEQPENYYFPSLEEPLTVRPRKVHQRSLFSSVEQLVSDKIKTKILFTLQSPSEERPAHTKLGNKWAYAFSESIFTQISYEYARENRGRLKNERGYLSGHTVGGQITWEPLFNLQCSAAYDLIVEDEDNPRTEAITRTAVDQYGLSIRYLWTGELITTLRSTYIVTNQNAKAYNLLGGIQWVF